MTAAHRRSGAATSRAAAAVLFGCLVGSGSCAVAAAAAEAEQPAAGISGTIAPAGTGRAAADGTPPVDPTLPADRRAAQSVRLLGIAGLSGASGHAGPVGLNEVLSVRLAPVSPATALPTVDARRYALFLNGREVQGLPDPIYSLARQSLLFELKRNSANKDLWTSLLGSPSPVEFTREVTVSLGERPGDPKEATSATIVGVTDDVDKLQLKELPPVRFTIAIGLIAGVIWLVFARTASNTTLRDNLLPQIMPQLQTYSLARCQMAFWFALIFCSFVFLYIVTWDFNTISQQALALMGISGATALGAIAVDVAKDSPADAVNRGLRALGINSYEDVLRIRRERDDRRDALAAARQEFSALPPPARRSADPTADRAALSQRDHQLQIELQDRETVLRTYSDRVRPFLTQGWFRDITTDLNGAAIHRLQVFCWTVVLGGVFLIGVYRNLAMPEFSGTLLALLGLSGAGYVGFKYPEKNS